MPSIRWADQDFIMRISQSQSLEKREGANTSALRCPSKLAGWPAALLALGALLTGQGALAQTVPRQHLWRRFEVVT